MEQKSVLPFVFNSKIAATDWFSLDCSLWTRSLTDKWNKSTKWCQMTQYKQRLLFSYFESRAFPNSWLRVQTFCLFIWLSLFESPLCVFHALPQTGRSRLTHRRWQFGLAALVTKCPLSLPPSDWQAVRRHLGPPAETCYAPCHHRGGWIICLLPPLAGCR